MKIKWDLVFGLLAGLFFWSFFNSQTVYASCTGSYTCGHIACNAATCSDGSGAGSCSTASLGNFCNYNRGTCICTSDGSCVADSNAVACTSSSDSNKCLIPSRGCATQNTCSCTGPTSTPGPPCSCSTTTSNYANNCPDDCSSNSKTTDPKTKKVTYSCTCTTCTGDCSHPSCTPSWGDCSATCGGGGG